MNVLPQSEKYLEQEVCVTPDVGIVVYNDSKLASYIIFDTYINDEKKTVYIFKDGVYNITWYDILTKTMVTNKNIHISNVGISAIMGQYIMDNCPEACLCAHRDDLMNYVSAKTVCIPLANISKIEDLSMKKCNEVKEVTKVAVLGISTEFIHSVVVRLRIYDDTNIDMEATVVDMEVGKTYKVAWKDKMDSSMYEIEGKLVKLCYDRHFGDEPPQTGFVRPECPNPEEVGMGNSIYYDQDHFFELSKDCPEKLLFIFDTSKVTESTYDYVRLTDIRDVTLIEEDTTEDTDEPGIGDGATVGTQDVIQSFEINELANAEVTKQCVLIKDDDGNILESVTFEDLVKLYAADKY